MKSSVLKNSARPISKSRWIAYATASAAATLVGTQQAAAEIHYSGRLDVEFPNGDPDDVTERAFPLDQPGDSIVVIHSNQHFLGSRSLVCGALAVGAAGVAMWRKRRARNSR